MQNIPLPPGSVASSSQGQTDSDIKCPELCCDKGFKNCRDYQRHQDVHEKPWERLACPLRQQGCLRTFPSHRNYTVRNHCSKDHNLLFHETHNFRPVDLSRVKIFACRFCFHNPNRFTSSDELNEHEWNHMYYYGKTKKDASLFVRILNLLQHSSVRNDWQNIARNRSINYRKPFIQNHLLMLIDELEWLGPHRQNEYDLARRAHDLLLAPETPTSASQLVNPSNTFYPNSQQGLFLPCIETAPEQWNQSTNREYENQIPSSSNSSFYDPAHPPSGLLTVGRSNSGQSIAPATPFVSTVATFPDSTRATITPNNPMPLPSTEPFACPVSAFPTVINASNAHAYPPIMGLSSRSHRLSMPTATGTSYYYAPLPSNEQPSYPTYPNISTTTITSDHHDLSPSMRTPSRSLHPGMPAAVSPSNHYTHSLDTGPFAHSAYQAPTTSTSTLIDFSYLDMMTPSSSNYPSSVTAPHATFSNSSTTNFNPALSAGSGLASDMGAELRSPTFNNFNLQSFVQDSSHPWNQLSMQTNPQPQLKDNATGYTSID